jgi:Flp pilus assembly pilin Flp
MLRKVRGASLVEYVVLVVLLIALVGGALVGLSLTISHKLTNVYVDIGS